MAAAVKLYRRRVAVRRAFWIVAPLSLATSIVVLVYAWLSPQCEFEKNVIQLGELPPDQEKELAVPISNPGTRTLQIDSIKSTCTCARVNGPATVRPGQTDVVNVALRIRPGPGSAQLTVYSNDPAGPKSIIISWHGKAGLTLLPHVLRVSNAPLDHPLEQVVRVIYPGGKSAIVPRFERFTCDSPLVEISEGRFDSTAFRLGAGGMLNNIQGERELLVKIQPPSSARTVRTNAIVKFACGKDTVSLALVIEAHFLGGKELMPDVDSIVFAAANAEELVGQERLVQLTDRASDSPLRIGGLPSWLDVSIAAEDGKVSVAKVKVIDTPNPSRGKELIQFYHQDGRGATLTLPVFVFTPEAAP
jgi:hypothetical protein